jgi:predicted site-specific integrase-resolvase
MTAQAEQLYTRQEACDRLRISISTLRRTTKKLRPRVKVVRFGRAVRYPESALAAIIEARSKEMR